MALSSNSAASRAPLGLDIRLVQAELKRQGARIA